MQDLVTVLLASGDETGMKSSKAKYAHELCGQAMVAYAVEAAMEAGTDTIAMILDRKLENLRDLAPENTIIEYHDETLGPIESIWTKKHIFEGKSGTLLIFRSDYPLVSGKTLKNAYKFHVENNNQATVLTTQSGLRSEICFINIESFISSLSGISDLSAIKKENDNKITNLSYIFTAIESSGQKLGEFCVADSNELLKVDDRITLANAEQVILKRIVRKHMENGVTFHLPETSIIHAGVQIGMDTVIMPGTILEGKTVIGTGCTVGPNSHIVNGVLGNDVSFANSVMTDSRVGDHTHVGPFAYIRPGSVIGEHIKIGDFVEIKNAVIGDNTKVSHLSYIGDAELGKNVNIGCGVVVVNYDGKKKHRTYVGDNAFVGCNVNLVSPVVVKDSAYIAAGSTITDEVPEYALAIARSRQTLISDWVIKKGLDKK